MSDHTFEAGKPYTIEELASLARNGLKEAGLTQREAAEDLTKRFNPERGTFRQPQISDALRKPTENPGMVIRMVRAFTEYDVGDQPRYILHKKE